MPTILATDRRFTMILAVNEPMDIIFSIIPVPPGQEILENGLAGI